MVISIYFLVIEDFQPVGSNTVFLIKTNKIFVFSVISKGKKEKMPIRGWRGKENIEDVVKPVREIAPVVRTVVASDARQRSRISFLV